MIITSPYVDLRKQPLPPSDALKHDPLQESQLLLGERVKVHYQRGSWLYIEALDQPHFHEGWGGYCGWIEEGHIGEGPQPNATVTAIRACLFEQARAGSLPSGRLWLGMRVATSPAKGVHVQGGFLEVTLAGKKGYIRASACTPHKPCEVAQAWIGSPYEWGKLMPPGVGTDCSGLVHLAYRAAGVIIPRNSGDQYRASTPCSSEEMVPGDLLFMADQPDPRTITHVLLYEGAELFLESTAAVNQTHRISAKKRFGYILSELRVDKKYGDHFLFFGKIDRSH